jgi:hypothetical protein
MGLRIEFITDTLENVGNDGDYEVWEFTVDPMKSDEMKKWAKSQDRKVLGVPIKKMKMPSVKLTIENME